MSPRKRARIIGVVALVGVVLALVSYQYCPGGEIVRLSLALGAVLGAFFVADRLAQRLPGYRQAGELLDPYYPSRLWATLWQCVLSGGRSPSVRRVLTAILVLSGLWIMHIMSRLLPLWLWGAFVAVVMLVLTVVLHSHLKRSQED